MTQLKCLLVLGLLAVVAIGPISISSLLGMWIVLKRPAWFLNVVEALYKNRDLESLATDGDGHSTGSRIKCFLSLLVLFVVDIGPVPVTELIAIIIVIGKPEWFYRLVTRIYSTVD